MRFIEEAEAQARLDEIIDEAQQRPIIIQRQGTDIAVLLSIAFYERLRTRAVQDFLNIRNQVAGEAAAVGLTRFRRALFPSCSHALRGGFFVSLFGNRIRRRLPFSRSPATGLTSWRLSKSHDAAVESGAMARHAIAILILGLVPAGVYAQADPPLELLCTDNTYMVGNNLAGPSDIKFRINYATRTVELLEDDGRVIIADRNAQVTDRTIKWGVGMYGLNTWQQLGRSNTSLFDGTIDREAGTGLVTWTLNSGPRERVYTFRGRCRISTRIY